MDRVIRADLGVFPDTFTVEEDVDVLANPALVVKHPPRRLGPGRFQGADHRTDIGALEPQLMVPSCEVLQRCAEDDDGHHRELAHPCAVEIIDAVPKTSVGKFDKKVLRERYKSWTPRQA